MYQLLGSGVMENREVEFRCVCLVLESVLYVCMFVPGLEGCYLLGLWWWRYTREPCSLQELLVGIPS